MNREDQPFTNYYIEAMHARRDIPAALLWALLKSQFFLAIGFVGATTAAIALRQLFVGQQARLTPLELALAAVAGIVVTAYAWYRSSKVLQPLADEGPSPETKVLVKPPVPALLGGYSRG